MMPLLILAARVMDTIFWKQGFGESEPFLDVISSEGVSGFVRINYGPWYRLAENNPFLSAFCAKPGVPQFYLEV